MTPKQECPKYHQGKETRDDKTTNEYQSKKGWPLSSAICCVPFFKEKSWRNRFDIFEEKHYVQNNIGKHRNKITIQFGIKQWSTTWIT